MIKLRVSKTLQAKIRKGHPWVFHYQIQNDVPRGEPGDLGVLYDHRNKFLAIGLWDPFSDLRLRILQTREPVEIGPEFFCRQLCRALESRKHLQAEGTTGYRVVHGENDGFPGLVLDRYDDTGVVKLYTAAWVPYLEPLLALFRDRVPLRRCVLRLGRNARGPIEATGKFRDGQGVFGPKVEGPVRFRENGLRFEAAVLSGPKTGFFLDQRENRRRFQALARDRSVLNGFSYSGAFSVYAFAGGGRSVMEIDTNLHALETSRKMVSLNFPGRSFGEAALAQRQGDAFEELKILREKGQAFDLVLLDPPAFASSRKQKARALSAYRRLAEAGARVTRSGGILFSCSCSGPVDSDEFLEAVRSGVRRAGGRCEGIERTGHAVDHPIAFPEAAYLKAVITEIAR